MELFLKLIYKFSISDVIKRLAVFRFVYLCSIACWALIACNSEPQKSQEHKVAWVKKPLKYSKRFSVCTYGNQAIIYLFGNRDLSDTTATFVLYSKTHTKPNMGADAFYVATPVNNIACMSSVYAAMLFKLGLQDRIIAVDNADYYNNQFILDKVASGQIKEIGKGPQINTEETLLLKPELLLMFGMGNPKRDADEKILSSGIPVAITLDHLEEHPLARAEWIKFIAAFFHKENVADSLFSAVEQNYLQLKKMTDTVINRPSVLTEIKYADAWHVPGGNSFMAHFLKDAGANYIWKNENRSGSIALNFEEVYLRAKEADFWLNFFINVNTKKDLLSYDERYALFKPFKTNHLYNNTKRVNSKGYSDYYENGLCNPDELLKDFIKLFHPSLLPNHQLKYYKKIE